MNAFGIMNFNFIEKGGLLMWPIVGCSVIALTVFIEKMIHLHRARIDAGKFLHTVRETLRDGGTEEAIYLCEETPGPVAAVIKAALEHAGESKEEMKEAVEEVSLHEVPRLGKNLVILSTVAHITPLLGLLGTVSGMIRAFMMIQEKAGLANPGELAQGIWVALITTAAGLVVAIPAYVAYNYLASRVDTQVLDMERCATDVINILSRRDEASKDS
ncbi:MAG: MotA/TolQ/ExbB proton channel family protein [Candidatus Tritonobacter lacicola]|nr:MotA/TolQ/ExbB proton channel family protein [Candidatus Tritonobacter lacicola]